MPVLDMVMLNEDTDNNIPMVEFKVNGKKYYFIIDTGAAISVLRSDVYPNYEQFHYGNGMTFGVGGEERELSYAVKLRLLNVMVKHFVISDKMFIKMKEMYNKEIGGLLGSDFLSKFKSVTFDYPNKKVRFEI